MKKRSGAKAPDLFHYVLSHASIQQSAFLGLSTLVAITRRCHVTMHNGMTLVAQVFSHALPPSPLDRLQDVTYQNSEQQADHHN